jgi:hypothetical protein
MPTAKLPAKKEEKNVFLTMLPGTMVKVTIDNQVVEIPVEYTLTDEMLIRVIAQFAPGYSSSKPVRDNTKGTISVPKKAGPKGVIGDVTEFASLYEAILAAPEHRNAVVELNEQLEGMDVTTLDPLMAEEISNIVNMALATSDAQIKRLGQILASLKALPPQPAPFRIPGF